MSESSLVGPLGHEPPKVSIESVSTANGIWDLIGFLLPSTAQASSERLQPLSSPERAAVALLLHSYLADLEPDLLAEMRSLDDAAHIWSRCYEQGRIRAPRVELPYGGPQLELDPILPNDIELLYRSSLDPILAHRWRFRGRTLSLDQFRMALTDGVLCQFVARSRSDSAPLALVSAYDADLNAGHLSIAVQRIRGSSSAHSAATEALAVFLRYVFDHFSVNRVRAEVPDFNLPAFGPFLQWPFRIEGRQEDYFYFRDQRFGNNLAVLERPIWADFSRVLLNQQ